MSTLILMRHGESMWNHRNLFTGWVDVPLSEKGIKEAIDGGETIKDIPIDLIFTSTLIRAHMTAMLATTNHFSKKVPVFIHDDNQKMENKEKIHCSTTLEDCIPVYKAWELNERWYGDLQGLNKQKVGEKYGEDQLKIWRRSYDVPPPNGESLEMTAERTLPYFRENIIPHLQKDKNIFISAHGNSLRSIIMELDGLNSKEVLQLEVPTGVPILYTFSDNVFKKV